MIENYFVIILIKYWHQREIFESMINILNFDTKHYKLILLKNLMKNQFYDL